MYIRQEAFINLIETKFNGNYHECARALNINSSTVWRVAKGSSSAGLKMLTKLMQYCNSNNLNYKEFIFLE